MSRKSCIWKYYEKVESLKARCVVCSKILKTSGNTTNLIGHMRSKHKVVFQNQTNFDSDINTVEIKVDDDEKVPNEDENITMENGLVSSSKSKSKKSRNSYYRRKDAADSLRPISSANSAILHADEFEVFGKQIAMQMRLLPEETSVQLMHEINNLLYYSRIKHLKRSPSSILTDESRVIQMIEIGPCVDDE